MTTLGCIGDGAICDAAAHWSLLRTMPQKQEHFVDLLKEYLPGTEAYYPVYTKMSRPHGQRKAREVQRPVYPGYLFVLIGNGGNMHGPVSLPVRASWVRFGGHVEAVPDFVIQKLRELEKANELVKEIRYVNPYYPGARVRVHTSVQDIFAVIVKITGKRAVVDMPLGRATVPIHRLQII